MRFAIVSNLGSRIGLFRDAELLTEYLESLGHEVQAYQFDDSSQSEFPHFDVAIFLEVIPRHYLGLADTKWAWLNPEWLKPDVLELARKYFSMIFTKTREAHRIISELIPGKTSYTGFLTRDQLDESVKRELRVLHVGGNSSLRGTQAVMDAWRWKYNGHALTIPLTVVSRSYTGDVPDGVTLLREVSEEELKQLQNSHAIHLYPSGTEGFGHALHEALGVGAAIITTGAPPMNEIMPCYVLPATGKTQYNYADVYEVSALDIHATVLGAAEDFAKKDFPGAFSIAARDMFVISNQAFKAAMDIHIACCSKPAIIEAGIGISEKETVAFLGNFDAPESTENMIRWALERLDYEVIPLQENTTNLREIAHATQFADFFLWVRTPGWLRVPEGEMREFLAQLKRDEKPSFSIHLDKFWGIPEREKLIGYHPFWRTQFVFTADGSRREDFKARGVNHYWMQPAISEVYCHPGIKIAPYTCDVGFVGAADYHSEYPFRRKLVDFLKEEYGTRFQHITNLRGHGLNDFYASCKVAVGDCIFAGTPKYWSDRVPETIGRGGFLLHPEVEGLPLDIATYKPQDLASLKQAIDYWVLHDEEREKLRFELMESFHFSDTWTVRMSSIMAIIREANNAG